LKFLLYVLSGKSKMNAADGEVGHM
jgi:hypothetical protein